MPDVKRPALPPSWIDVDGVLHCLSCRREIAADAGVEDMPEDTPASRAPEAEVARADRVRGAARPRAPRQPDRQVLPHLDHRRAQGARSPRHSPRPLSGRFFPGWTPVPLSRGNAATVVARRVTTATRIRRPRGSVSPCASQSVGGRLDLPESLIRRKHYMSSQSFADLGVSSPVVGALAKRGITEPFAVQRLAIADVLDRQGRARPVADRVGQDARLRRADGRPDQRRGAPPRGARARPHQGAGRADRRRDAPRSPIRGRSRSHPSSAGSASRPRPARPRKAHIVVATPGRLEDLIERGHFKLEADPDPGPGRGRPHARHGLQARRRPHRRPDAEGPPDAVLLGHARGRGRQARQGLHPRRRPPRAQARRSRQPGRRPSTASSTSATRRSWTRWSAS